MSKYEHRRKPSQHPFWGYAAALTLLVTLPLASRAATPTQWAQCEKYDDAGIAACTRIIQSKQEPVAERIKAHIKRAWHHHFKEDPARATADFEAAIKLGPDRAETYDTWAWVFNDNVDVAIDVLSRAIELEDSAYRRQQRSAYHRRRGDETKANADDRQALVLVNAAIEKGPVYPYIFKQRSDIYRELGAIDAALADFDEFLKRKAPSDHAYLDDYTNLHLQKANFDKALAAIGEAKKGSDYDTRMRRALVFRAKGDYTHAIAEYDSLVGQYSGAEIFAGRGLAYAGLGRFNRAIVDFTKAIDGYPELAEAHYNRAQATREDGNPEGSIADYDKAIELDPTNAAFYNSRGRAHLALGDRTRALADFEKAIAIDPKFAAAYCNRAFLQQAAGRLDDAIVDFSRANAIDPDEKNFLHARAQALTLHKRYGDAERDYTLALRIDPTDTHVYVARAQAREKLGKLAEAMDDVNRALVINSNLLSGYAVRGEIFARLGDEKSAETDRLRVEAAKALIESEKKQAANRPTPIRISVKGKFPLRYNSGGTFELGTSVVVRGDRIFYETPNMPIYEIQSGDTHFEKFFGTCSGQTTTNEGERYVTASLDKDLLHIQLRSRLEFTTGACRGRHNYYKETFMIDLHKGACKFDYVQERDLFGVGAFDNNLADQPCVVETLR